MHILEQYSLACGVKIKKPFILEKYFPINFDKYIVFHAPNKFQSRTYDYWGEVLSMISPLLKKENIHIVQIGSKEEKIYSEFCYTTNGQTDFNQLAYIIKNSSLLLGIDSFPIHLASYYDRKIVGLYCNMYKEHSKPYWGNESNHCLIESERFGLKPSYSSIENKKTINLIKPEYIAQKVLDMLEIKHEIEIETILVGDKYSNPIIEMIPSNPVNISNLNIGQINVRMDQHFNQNVLEEQLLISKCSILTNKPIDIKLIKNYKNNINKFIFFVNKNFNHEYLLDFINLGIPYEIASFESEKEINKLKINYMDIGHVFKIDTDKYKNIINSFKNDKNIKFKSSKRTLFNNKVYPSLYHAKNDINSSDLIIKENNDYFVEDLDFFYIYKEKA